MRLRAETVIGHHKTDMGVGSWHALTAPTDTVTVTAGFPPHEPDPASATFP
jgi:hypothetical protein